MPDRAGTNEGPHSSLGCLPPAEVARAKHAEPVSPDTVGGHTIDVPWLRSESLVVTSGLS